MDEQLLKGHLPVLVLGIIEEAPVHGYALAKEIKRRGGRLLKTGEGTLYPLLYRLESQGLIASAWEIGPTGRDRKVYRITQAGRRRIAEGRADWLRLCNLMREFLGKEWQTT